MSVSKPKVFPTVLLILDGFGLPDSDPSLGNAIQQATTPCLDYLFDTFPHSTLQTSGKAVGLPDQQMGNSEVGHLTIGAGRIIHSDLVRITQSLEEESIIDKPTFHHFTKTLQNNHQKLHLIGLLSDGGVHSHIDHLYKLILLFHKYHPNIHIHIHAFLDGRDTSPRSGIGFVQALYDFIKQANLQNKVFLISIIGRYYAMDRDQRWERTQRAYTLLVHAQGMHTNNIFTTIQNYYNQDITDEFMPPIICHQEYSIQTQDSVLFFNFRSDRARQLTQILTGWEPHATNQLNLNFLCLTQYKDTFNLPVLFEPIKMNNLLGEIISKYGLRQLRLAETEKYAHVTFFFNGGVETEYPGEKRILIPSPKVQTYDLQPSMSAPDICDILVKKVSEQYYDLIIVNFANGDMVGHTGNMKATQEAVEVLDKCLETIFVATQKYNYHLFITADHGNCEQMLATNKITPFTQHTTTPVPFICASAPFKKEQHLLNHGSLADIAPTILTALNVPIPSEMTGKNLFTRDIIPPY